MVISTVFSEICAWFFRIPVMVCVGSCDVALTGGVCVGKVVYMHAS
jgi:hypothetical protein